MATHKIALLDGDGIGPEIMAEAVKILDLVAQRND
ncbi:MAG: isocitrate/isopropylmalate family dehydrogenase, partial [OM182 bacterium]|nr:isocitrate/isopropylmalate family dehydrogenase [OM182 bacterium]